jgi:hypothetical protein
VRKNKKKRNYSYNNPISKDLKQINMKPNFTYKKIYNYLPLLAFFVFSSNIYSQTPKFTTPTLISGTDKQVNAKYRYNNVITKLTALIDAIVTIVSIKDASIVDFDNPTNGGLIDRFQPVINTLKSNGYVEFEFSFIRKEHMEQLKN